MRLREVTLHAHQMAVPRNDKVKIAVPELGGYVAPDGAANRAGESVLARDLTAQGSLVRDVGEALNASFQRAQQMIFTGDLHTDPGRVCFQRAECAAVAAFAATAPQWTHNEKLRRRP